ncbi:MAG: NAD(P)/FAD-dependent oxidoreductase [Thermoprotei archaeon]|nr:NAD(P)/FAD-dependent oxidoreductase [Thermoprotei archaeon]
MREERVDVLVIGGGPAGLAAGIEASEGGEVSVLIVEKGLKLAEKPCAEAVSAATLSDLGVKPSPRIVRNRIKGALVYAPNGKDYVEIRRGPEEGYIVNKRALLEHLAIRARRSGALFWIGSPALNFRVNERGFVNEVLVSRRGERIVVRPKVIIACDGIGSMFGRGFFKRGGYEVIPTAQYVLADAKVEDEHMLEIRVGRNVAPGGYLWVFPREEGIVGIGAGVKGAPAKEFIDKFMKENRDRFFNTTELEYGASAVPISGQVETRVKRNVMLCGDAAGQVIPLTGGGIHSASMAGKIAGKVAREAVLENEVSEHRLQAYVKEYDEYWGNRIRQSLKALKVIERLSDEDLNELAKVLSGEDVINLANGLNISKVASKLMRHPLFAVKLAKALL